MRFVIVRWLFVLILLVLIVITTKFAVADFYFDRANNSYKKLNIGQLRSAKFLTPAMKDVDKSLSWRRDNAQTLDLKAVLLYQQWWLSPDAQFFNQSELLRNAEKYHLEALKLRQDWSFTYAQLVFIHSNKRKLDDEFAFWFSKAFEFGRYETAVARSVMEVGFRYWAQLNQSQKDMTIEFARISIEQKSNSPQLMKDIFTQYGLIKLVCEKIEATERKNKVCSG